MTTDNPHGYIFAERGSSQWDAAWDALMAAGHGPEQFMLMHGEPKGETISWGFKHVATREYLYVEVPA